MQHMRVSKARESLEFSILSIKEIAWLVGRDDRGLLRTACGKLRVVPECASVGSQNIGVKEVSDRSDPHYRRLPSRQLNSQRSEGAKE
jgi:hypothetical protein